MPAVSIIVPVYNREATIRVCINSILNLSFKDFELIIVDDGSTDNSYSVCEELAQKDSRIRLFKRGNKGVSAARNVGILNAIGEWITFIDSDDIVLPQHLDIIEREGTKDVELLMVDLTNGYIKNGQPITKISLQKNFNIIYADCAAKYLFSSYKPFENPIYTTVVKFFRRGIILNNRIHFDESMSLGEDQVFVCNYLYKARAIAHYCIATYVCLDWGGISHLGNKLRSPEEFLYNQMKNYEALCSIIPIAGEGGKTYSINYGIDRPITRILYRYTEFRNRKLLKRGELADFTEKHIIPFISSIDVTVGNARSINVRFVRLLLLRFGAKTAIFWCSFYNVMKLPLRTLRKLKSAIFK